MNDRRFLTVEQSVRRRRRRLNTLAGAQLGGLVTMTLTLAHLIAVYLGTMVLVQPWWTLIVVNAIGLLAGAQIGRRRSVDVQRDLYRLDRAYALGEKLTTIHEIRQKDDRNPYLRLLYDRIQREDLNPTRALRPSRRERQGWTAFGVATTASVALLFMWFVGIPPLSVSSLLASDGGDPPLMASSANETDPASTESRDGGGAPNNPTEPRDQQDSRSRIDCDEASGATSDSALRANINENCNNRRSSSNPEDGGTETRSSSSEGSPEEARMSVQQLRRQLENLQRRTASGDLSSDAAQRELEQLAQEARSPSLRELLQRAAQSSSLDQLQQGLQDALNEMQRQAEQAQEGSGPRGLDPDADLQRQASGQNESSQGDTDGTDQGRTEGQTEPTDEGSGETDEQSDDPNAEGQPESQPGAGQQRSQSGAGPNDSGENDSSQSAQQGGSSESGDQNSGQESQEAGESGQGDGDEPSSGEPQGSRPGDVQPQSQTDEGDDSSGDNQQSSSQSDGESDDSNTARPDAQAQGQQDGSGTPGGSSPGSGPGGNNDGQSGEAEGPSANGLRIQSPDLPQDVETMRALMTEGVPFDIGGGETADGSPRLELDPDRVETLLRSRDLPPEVRDLVRAYFLSLAEGE